MDSSFCGVNTGVDWFCWKAKGDLASDLGPGVGVRAEDFGAVLAFSIGANGLAKGLMFLSRFGVRGDTDTFVVKGDSGNLFGLAVPS